MSQNGAAGESARPGWLATLRPFVRERAPAERCELCSAILATEHRHLIEPANRQLLCCCDACSILFSGRADGRFRQVPRRARALPQLRLDDSDWEALRIPINVAFFYRSSVTTSVVALYPSPAGATESHLPPAAWQALVAANPPLGELEEDVEALLVNRLGGAREYFVVPIDQCFKLVGLVRVHWRGLSGGPRVWEEIEQFFKSLKETASEQRITPPIRAPIAAAEQFNA